MKNAIIRAVLLGGLASLTACVQSTGTTPVTTPVSTNVENGVSAGCHIATAAEAAPAAASLIEHNGNIIAGQTIVCAVDAALLAQAQATQASQASTPAPTPVTAP